MTPTLLAAEAVAPASGVSTLLPLLIAIPLASAAILLLLGKRSDAWGHWLGLLAPVVSFVLGVAMFVQMHGRPADARAVSVHMYSWITVGSYHVDAALQLDQLSMVFVLLILGVGSLIHLYSVGYMSHDPRRRRFFAYLNLFVAAMLLLVLANDYLLMFVGWEGVGLAQVRGQTDAFPADEHQQVVVRQHQQQHRRDEQVQVGEEPAAARIVAHVAHRVQVDERAHAEDEQHEHHRELVELQRGVDVIAADGDPRIHVHRDGTGIRQAVHLDEHRHAEHERHDRGRRPRASAPRRRCACRAAGSATSGQGDGDQQGQQRADTGGGSASAASRVGVTTRPSSELEQARVVDRGRPASAEDGHQDRQADDDLGGGHDHDEERHDLPVEIPAERQRMRGSPSSA